MDVASRRASDDSMASDPGCRPGLDSEILSSQKTADSLPWYVRPPICSLDTPAEILLDANLFNILCTCQRHNAVNSSPQQC
jgi:hypothetical protein